MGAVVPDRRLAGSGHHEEPTVVLGRCEIDLRLETVCVAVIPPVMTGRFDRQRGVVWHGVVWSDQHGQAKARGMYRT